MKEAWQEILLAGVGGGLAVFGASRVDIPKTRLPPFLRPTMAQTGLGPGATQSGTSMLRVGSATAQAGLGRKSMIARELRTMANLIKRQGIKGAVRATLRGGAVGLLGAQIAVEIMCTAKCLNEK